MTVGDFTRLCRNVLDCAEHLHLGAIACDPLVVPAAMANEQTPKENQDKTHVFQEKMQVRVLGLEPRTHGLKVRNDYLANASQQTTCDNSTSAALHICGQSECEPVRDNSTERPSLEQLLSLWNQLTINEQWAAIAFMDKRSP